MKNKILFLFCVVVSISLSLSCSESPVPPPLPNEYTSRTVFDLSIADSLGNDVFRTIPFSPEEVKDTSLSIKAQLFQNDVPMPSILYFAGMNKPEFPDTLLRKRLIFALFDSIAYKKSDVAPFHRTYRLGVRIPQLFLDKEYRFFELSYVYDKRKVKLLSATFEGQELPIKNYPPIEDKLSLVKGHALAHLVYTPKGK